MAAPNPERQRAARVKMEDLLVYPASVFVIHYACQSFDQGQKLGSPRVTAITVRNVDSGDTWVFSIQREQEIVGLGPIQVLSRIDELEYSMLDKFFDFLAINRNNRFVHWNMRDAMYGFAAIEHRFTVLGGEPVTLSEGNRFDLARALAEIYGSDYAERPYIKGLAKLNALSLSGFLEGPEEAEAFETGEYDAVQRSVLAKVNVLFKVLHLAHDRTLATTATWWTSNRGRVREAYEMFEKNPLYAVLTVTIAVAMGAFKIVFELLSYLGV